VGLVLAKHEIQQILSKILVITCRMIGYYEQQLNRNKTFTGWNDDADFTDQGTREMEHAARLLREQGYEIDCVYLTPQASHSYHMDSTARAHSDSSWRINERHYGSLTGVSQTQSAERLGVDLVQEWRDSLRSRPPPMTEDHPYYPGRERNYADLNKEKISLTVSLLDFMERTIPLWENKILYENSANGLASLLIGAPRRTMGTTGISVNLLL
jgi:2,3-bisphosphoglycerate-dependent phosphoglycerate mutase